MHHAHAVHTQLTRLTSRSSQSKSCASGLLCTVEFAAHTSWPGADSSARIVADLLVGMASKRMRTGQVSHARTAAGDGSPHKFKLFEPLRVCQARHQLTFCMHGQLSASDQDCQKILTVSCEHKCVVSGVRSTSSAASLFGDASPRAREQAAKPWQHL